MKRESHIESFLEHTEKLNISDVSDNYIEGSSTIFFYKEKEKIGEIFFEKFDDFLYISWIQTNKGIGKHIINYLLLKNKHLKYVICDIDNKNTKSLFLFENMDFERISLENLPNHIKKWYIKRINNGNYEHGFFKIRTLLIYYYQSLKKK
jgi:hypothetical protein